MKTLRRLIRKIINRNSRDVLILTLLVLNHFISFSQCPVNIDFESGTFDGWVCLTGEVGELNGANQISLQSQPGPVGGQHTMLSSFPGDGLDEYGGFPKNCPNGGGHSIKLGNDRAGGFAEGVSYQFIIPQNSNKFTLTYNYAVVFEDPGHDVEKQPRLEIEIRDLTDDEIINCFSFTYIADNSLPGFQISPLQPNFTPVLYKDWTTNTVYLNGYQGKQIGLYMRTADCTYSVHFGYAYLDVSSACDNSFAGENYCAQDTAVNITAPFGYRDYRWYNSSLTQLMGSLQQLRLEPPPPAGTTLAVELVPFPGYGCRDTLFVDLQDTLTATANAGPDVASCNFNKVQLGVPPVSGMSYSWSPAYGLSDPAVANPRALPATDTTYILTIQSAGGGCFSTDTVKVFVRNIDNSLQLTGDSIYCMGNGPAPLLTVSPVNSVQWFRNNQPISGANQLSYSVTATGNYHASLVSDICLAPVLTREILFVVDTAAPGITYPLVDIAYNFPIQLRARSFNNGVLWTPGLFLDDRTSATPYFKSLTGILYTIELKNPLGCITVDTQLVKTHKEIAIYVPAAFTPNADGVNDYLRPLLLGFEKVKYFRVYNRSGELLFVTTSDFPGWNGRTKQQVQETQTVVWILEAIDIDGKTHFRTGSSLLIH